MTQEPRRLATTSLDRPHALEARAAMLVCAFLAFGVALAPVGAGLIFASGAAAGAGLLLSRRGGNTLDRTTTARLSLFAIVAFIINALFTPGTPLSVWGRELPLSVEGFRVGGETALRIVALVLLFRGLVQSVAPLEVVSVVERALTPLRRYGIRSEKLAVVLMIALQVAPSFATEARRLSLQRALRRGWPGPAAPPSVRRRRLRMRLRDLPAVVVPLMGLALRRAEELAWALPARYFAAGERTPPRARIWTPREWGAVASAAVLLAVTLWARGRA